MLKKIFNHQRVCSKTKNEKLKNRSIIATGLHTRCVKLIQYRDHVLISVCSDAIMQYLEEIVNPYVLPSKQTVFWKRCRKTHWVIRMIHMGSFCRLYSESTTQTHLDSFCRLYSESTTQTTWTTLGNWSICFCLLRPVKQQVYYVQLVYFSRSIKLLDQGIW